VMTTTSGVCAGIDCIFVDPFLKNLCILLDFDVITQIRFVALLTALGYSQGLYIGEWIGLPAAAQSTLRVKMRRAGADGEET
jgi:hypothetical protein